MFRRILQKMTLAAAIAALVSVSASAQSISPVEGEDSYDSYQSNNAPSSLDRARIDRYLDVEIWSDHDDGEYYVGDNVSLKFRANRDAFVAIYTIDSRGHVNLLFPTDQRDNNFVEGGVTYQFPGGADDFDLAVTGPEGVENIQIIASREKFPIPDWYPASGMIADWDDRDEYMDYLNNRYFVKYDGQRFAYDRTALFINEWEDYYFRPVYHPYYPSWTVAGNIYVDYPIGSSIYINGVYWGCTPLYIPRIYVGWHTFTIYDRFGHCWEDDVHVYRYNTVILDDHIIHPRRDVSSKYKEVRFAGYRAPEANGYPDYKKKSAIISSTVAGGAVIKNDNGKTVVTKSTTATKQVTKRYSKGTTEVVKTDRGYESLSPSDKPSSSYKGTKSGSSKTGYGSSKSNYDSDRRSKYSTPKKGSTSSSGTKSGSYDKKSTGSKSYYKGSTSKKGSSKSATVKKSSGSSSKSAPKSTAKSGSSSSSKGKSTGGSTKSGGGSKSSDKESKSGTKDKK